jgi:hypothetical protein
VEEAQCRAELDLQEVCQGFGHGGSFSSVCRVAWCGCSSPLFVSNPMQYAMATTGFDREQFRAADVRSRDGSRGDIEGRAMAWCLPRSGSEL